MAKPLTAKQDMFCLEYLIDLNATQAAIRAGYSSNTAKEQGYENLTKPHIQARVAKAMKERSENTKIDAAYVLKMSNELLLRCMVDGEDFSPSGAGKALDLIGKHVNVQAFNEKTTSETTLKVEKSLADRLTSASKR